MNYKNDRKANFDALFFLRQEMAFFFGESERIVLHVQARRIWDFCTFFVQKEKTSLKT